MRILEHMTAAELNSYTSQPTAKKLLEKTLRDGKCIAPGDKDAAAVYVAGRNQEKGASPDTVEISKEGQALSEQAAAVSFRASRVGDSNRFRLSFDSSAMLHRAVKQGYVEVEGSRIELSDDVKKQLLATDRELQENRKRIAMQNFLLHEAANARQASDAMKEANDKMSRVMTTASRIMHGKRVSPADEKELMEYDKDLYAMAKNAAALAKHRRKGDDKEDERVSEANDRARERESAPKDYSVEEIEMPRTEAQMTVSLDGETPQVLSVGKGLPEE